MCCTQIHVLSDVGLHCSIVEDYILSSGLPFITHMEKEQKPAGWELFGAFDL